MVRLNSDGTEDAAFYTNLGASFSAAPLIAAVQSDGKILVGGTFTSFDGNTRNRMVRLNSDGTEDTAFYTNLGTGFDNDVNSIVEHIDNKVLVGGNFITLDGNTRNKMVKLLNDSPDTNLIEVGEFKGVYRDDISDWAIGGNTYIEDDAGVGITITSSGELQYTTTELLGTPVEESIKLVIKKF
jgi:hypothetical protein